MFDLQMVCAAQIGLKPFNFERFFVVLLSAFGFKTNRCRPENYYSEMFFATASTVHHSVLLKLYLCK